MLSCLTGMVAGATQQVTARFSSVGQAVATLPELSVLNSQVSKISLASQLNSPSFVGTVFAPINSVSSRSTAATEAGGGGQLLLAWRLAVC